MIVHIDLEIVFNQPVLFTKFKNFRPGIRSEYTVDQSIAFDFPHSLDGIFQSFFGFFGRFWSRRLGHHRMYATNMRDLVFVERVDGTKFILSPYPADVFVAAVEEARR